MHYDEALLLQKLRRKPIVTKKVLVDTFIETFPYGASYWCMQPETFRKFVEENIDNVVDFIKPHGLTVVDIS